MKTAMRIRAHALACRAATVAAAALLSSCATTVVPVREYCSTFQPIFVHCGPQGCGYYLEGYDFLTKPTADQILAADRTWKELCHK